jgi:hypothetical protein
MYTRFYCTELNTDRKEEPRLRISEKSVLRERLERGERKILETEENHVDLSRRFITCLLYKY